MAKSPFPGMDPYLELDWLDVHSRLVTYTCDQIQDQLPGDLLARMKSRVLVEDDDRNESRQRHPDVRVVETGERNGGAVAVLDLPRVATIEPDIILRETRIEPVNQRFVEIVDAQTRSRVVTTIELISPTNKRRGIDQRLYLAKRDECLDAGVNVVEIDLTRGGNRFTLLPELASLDPTPIYVGCVRRAGDPPGMAVYVMSYDAPLKPMRIPLRPKDEDIVLHLQPLVEMAYQRGRYDRLDYTRPLDPPPAQHEAAAMEQILKRAAQT